MGMVNDDDTDENVFVFGNFRLFLVLKERKGMSTGGTVMFALATGPAMNSQYTEGPVIAQTQGRWCNGYINAN